MNFKYLYILLIVVLGLSACKKDEPEEETSPANTVVYDASPYTIQHPNHFPPPLLPADNPLTVQGVKLGKMLFHETLLSADNSQACASCHLQANAFSDPLQFSIGVQGLPGERHSMSVFNMAWNNNGFFWDGRAPELRDQAILPILDELEMDETLENVIEKLGAEENYRHQFIRAFGSEEITAEKIALALEQFMFSIVSVDSKYDRFLQGTEELTESEERGRLLFFAEYNPFFPEDSGADCAHCHSGINFENDQYMNNGLDSEAEITDEGRKNVTGLDEDRARFKVTSLRNIAESAPYMHDGRFNTLEEVIAHYNEGIQASNSVDPAILATSETGLMLTDQDIQDLIAFLHTLSDEIFLSNPAYQAD
ncbi:MAG: cytochrome c peroxidase [Flavobacteriales bacterium]|nr:cytochrome c peroxidase [Flavobacteriales bacterium]